MMYECPVCGALVEVPMSVRDGDEVTCTCCEALLHLVADADCSGDPLEYHDASYLVEAMPW